MRITKSDNHKRNTAMVKKWRYLFVALTYHDNCVGFTGSKQE